jgi:hypothetical protein
LSSAKTTGDDLNPGHSARIILPGAPVRDRLGLSGGLGVENQRDRRLARSLHLPAASDCEPVEQAELAGQMLNEAAVKMPRFGALICAGEQCVAAPARILIQTSDGLIGTIGLASFKNTRCATK